VPKLPRVIIRRVTTCAVIAAAVVAFVAAAEAQVAPEGMLVFLREPMIRPQTAPGPRNAAVLEVDAAGGSERLIRRLQLTRHAWSPNGRRLAFIGRTATGLSVVELESGRLRRLLPRATSFGWSQDSRWLAAFGSTRGRHGLIVVDANGRGRPRVIVPARSNRSVLGSKQSILGWSPDGRFVAYGFTIRPPDADMADGREGLVVVDVSGNRKPHVIVTAETFLTVQWSPDGSKLAYVDSEGKYTCCVLHVVNRDGRGDRMLTGNQLRQAINPTWSPDGRSIAYCSCGQGAIDLRVIAIDGSTDRTVATNLLAATWSPDGSLLAGTRDVPGDPTRGMLVVVRADGSGERTVATNAVESFWNAKHTTPTLVGSPVWSPDGRTIAYVGADNAGVHVYRVDADGGNAQQLTHASASDTWLYWRPPDAGARRMNPGKTAVSESGPTSIPPHVHPLRRFAPLIS
jgi:Tol biopolymer transport system component